MAAACAHEQWSATGDERGLCESDKICMLRFAPCRSAGSHSWGSLAMASTLMRMRTTPTVARSLASDSASLSLSACAC